MKLKANPTLIETARRMWPAVTGLKAIVRMAEIAVAAADVPVEVDAIAAAAGAADVLAVAGVIVDAAGLAAEDTRNFIATDLRGFTRRNQGKKKEATTSVVASSASIKFKTTLCRPSIHETWKLSASGIMTHDEILP